MTKRDPIDCIEDILKYSRDILAISKNLSKQEFTSNIEKQYSLLHCIEVIGEATKRLLSISPDFRSNYPMIDWKSIVGMRDILIHHYEEANQDIVWDTIQKDIPKLEKDFTQILAQVIGK
ncbi:MAG: hypothetical protein A3I11_06465 [Elusimicrobia bacterium RIFCSPLOWO2_02_FULL_39_32]|nr:MAG: hypothetical protein A2034_07135 [Elusimicrobia bacterium GWA2_38_7]OGR81208.1 MAG: hypothetical protein A3B80_09075 [Elusimicrobia bacterium RIFCSPHIGHO2_02_FULL_39_36]OGR91760.1 MAG: hypothetical protein A3I11_06465 [Elusimicrobia bacterium RIFCSPLOWO2_02_FULL_39_32]OGR98420.1 MAG: hypothetical protein A3G85_02325 [Elusimicrobia bacterium RIFCSPLOWO2_12_FULL_39_28]